VNETADDSSRRYSELIDEAAANLDDQLARIRQDTDDGTITLSEAADERIQVLTEHLNRLRQLREQFLGG
jgi:hypothetical protein